MAMTARKRADLLLVERGLFDSRAPGGSAARISISEIISCFPRRLLRKFFKSLSDSSGAPGNYCHMDVLK